jgi:hypothetical protein
MFLRIDPYRSSDMQISPRSDDPIRSLRDLARRWGVSMDTVRRRVAAGELRVVRLSPRRIGVRASEEERYLREREGLSPAA